MGHIGQMKTVAREQITARTSSINKEAHDSHTMKPTHRGLRLASFLGLIRTFGEASICVKELKASGAAQAVCKTRRRSRSNFARPNIWRLMSLSR